MSILDRRNFINNNTLNIFTDASIIHRKIQTSYGEYRYYIGSPGAEFYIGDKKVYSYHTIIPHCTNNQSEITAIEYGINIGVQIAKKYDVENINIFSDSKICIFGIREWIFNWVKNMNDGVLYNTSGPVANQYHFISIIQSVLANGRRINFYHVRGHFNFNDYKSRRKFNMSFMKENNSNLYLDEKLIDFFILSNDSVDKITRNSLKNIPPELLYQWDLFGRSICKYNYFERIFNWNDSIASLDMRKYKSLIGGN